MSADHIHRKWHMVHLRQEKNVKTAFVGTSRHKSTLYVGTAYIHQEKARIKQLRSNQTKIQTKKGAGKREKAWQHVKGYLVLTRRRNNTQTCRLAGRQGEGCEPRENEEKRRHHPQE